MTSPAKRLWSTGVATAVLSVLLAARAGAAAKIEWMVFLQPPTGGGTMAWVTTSPPDSGVFTKNGSIFFNADTEVTFTIQANPGYEFTRLLQLGQDFTRFVNSAGQIHFGPGINGHSTFVVTFSPIPPTGTVDLAAPTANPSVPRMADVSGTYCGFTPAAIVALTGRPARAYCFTVAMDAEGKLDVIGTCDGVIPASGGGITAKPAGLLKAAANEISGTVGTLTTVDGQPTVRLKAKFEGTVDGVPASTQGSLTAGLDLKDLGGGNTGVDAVLSAKGVLGGVPVPALRNAPIPVPLSPEALGNVRKAWGLHIDLQKQPDPVSGKNTLMAGARLTLPNGDSIEFPPRKAKFSPKTGYSLSFKGGTNVTQNPAAVDTQTTFRVKKMTVAQEGQSLRPTGGTIDYRFLGQKGRANLVDFLAP